MNIRVLIWNKPRTPTENELRTLLEKEGMKPYLAVLERGESDDIHKNNNDETHIVLEGQIEFCAEGRMFTLKPGDRIDIKKGTPHTAKNLERGQSVMLCGNK